MVRAGFELAERDPVVPPAGRDRRAPATRSRWACSSLLVRRLPHRRRRAVQARGQRGGDRADACRTRRSRSCRHRLTPAHFDRAVVLAEPFSPEAAVDAGFLDRGGRPAADLAETRAGRRHRASPTSTGGARRQQAAGPGRHRWQALASGNRRRVRRAAGRRARSADRAADQAAHRRAARPGARGSRSTCSRREGVAGVHHPAGRGGRRDLDPGRLRALRRQGRARARGLLRGLPAAARRASTGCADTDDPRADLLACSCRSSARFVRANPDARPR